MKAKLDKTNAMRKLDAMKLSYREHTYTDTDAISGVEVAAVLGQEPDKVFKTLVTQGKSENYYVFMVPVAEELDLKKAAKAVGEKSIEMIKSKDLLPLTGYVHGGCSPIGMKKFFPTTIHETAPLYDTIFSAAAGLDSRSSCRLRTWKRSFAWSARILLRNSYALYDLHFSSSILKSQQRLAREEAGFVVHFWYSFCAFRCRMSWAASMKDFSF